METVSVEFPELLKSAAIEEGEAKGYKDLSEFVRESVRQNVSDARIEAMKREMDGDE